MTKTMGFCFLITSLVVTACSSAELEANPSDDTVEALSARKRTVVAKGTIDCDTSASLQEGRLRGQMLVAMAEPISESCRETNREMKSEGASACSANLCLDALEVTSNGPAELKFSVKPTLNSSSGKETTSGDPPVVVTDQKNSLSVEFAFEATSKVGKPKSVLMCKSALNHPAVVEFGTTLAKDTESMKSNIAKVKAACEDARAARARGGR